MTHSNDKTTVHPAIAAIAAELDIWNQTFESITQTDEGTNVDRMAKQIAISSIKALVTTAQRAGMTAHPALEKGSELINEFNANRPRTDINFEAKR